MTVLMDAGSFMISTMKSKQKWMSTNKQINRTRAKSISSLGGEIFDWNNNSRSRHVDVVQKKIG
jgi:hypothetical protein